MNKSIEKDIISSTEPVYSLGTASKLSEISIYSIRQYIDNGLIIPHTIPSQRYYFYQFEIYQTNDDDPYSISGTEACQIREDNDGNLWVLSNDYVE